MFGDQDEVLTKGVGGGMREEEAPSMPSIRLQKHK